MPLANPRPRAGDDKAETTGWSSSSNSTPPAALISPGHPISTRTRATSSACTATGQSDAGTSGTTASGGGTQHPGAQLLEVKWPEDHPIKLILEFTRLELKVAPPHAKCPSPCCPAQPSNTTGQPSLEAEGSQEGVPSALERAVMAQPLAHTRPSQCTRWCARVDRSTPVHLATTQDYALRTSKPPCMLSLVGASALSLSRCR